MITKYPNGEMTLTIFERFVIDYNLPKYKDSNKEVEKDFQQVGAIRVVDSSTNSFQTFSTSQFNITGINNGQPLKLNVFESIKNSFVKIKKWFEPKPIEVQKVFELILKNKKELDIVSVKIEGYVELIRKAKSMGQIALAEKLEKELPIKLLEQKLFVSEFKRFINEKDLIKFAIKCEKGLQLTYVTNFIRQIPKEVADRKISADSLNIFDNYVILHYDPDNKATEMTEKEKEKAKDPILFGLIRNSRKLYFIGDWKDELCDLTFDEIVKKLEVTAETDIL